MKRNALRDLMSWKANAERKPLVLKGARQVGKTWLMKEFGKTQYKNYVYFNFDEEDELKSIFETNKNPQRIIELLSLISGFKILPRDTLIIFDEVQECPAALNSLKYFKEKANEYHVIAAGSLLGTLLAQPKSYPVGMVNLLDIAPLTFDEFLEAIEPNLFIYYNSIQKDQHVEEIFHNRLLETYNNYLIIGGMPECVSSWIRYKDPARIIQIQRELIEVYENDFSKHNGKVNSGRILQSQMKNSCTELSEKADGRATLRKQSNGLYPQECSIAFTMYQRWNIRSPLSTNWNSSSCLSLIRACLNIWLV